MKDKKMLFGTLGSVLLFIGVFAPIVKAPFVGDINYFSNGKGDGVIILILAVISIFLVLAKKFKFLWLTGLLSLGLLLFTFINFQIKMSGIVKEFNTSMADNPFAGLGSSMIQSIQIQYGWALLVLGSILLLVSAYLKEEK